MTRDAAGDSLRQRKIKRLSSQRTRLLDSSRNDPLPLHPNDDHAMRSPWKSFRYQLEWLGVRLLAAIVPRLPRPVAVQFARRSPGRSRAYLDRPGRRVALSNLEAAFGDRFSAAERARITRESYQQFAATMIDLFWSPRINAEELSEADRSGEAGTNSLAPLGRPVPASSPPVITATSSGSVSPSATSGMPARSLRRSSRTRSSIRFLTGCASSPGTRWHRAKVRS